MLFNMPKDDCIQAGLNPLLLRQKREQFKQRFKTLKRALAELEDEYGIQITQRRLTINGDKGLLWVDNKMNQIP